MISIRKYLSQPGPSRSTGQQIDDREDIGPLITAAAQLCGDIEKRVLDKPRFDSLRAEVAVLKAGIASGITSEEACKVGKSLSRILEEYELRREQASIKTAAEMQSIVAMLNQAVITLAAGHDRSVSRLESIQVSLQHTSRLKDIVAMRTSLTDALKFVQSECSREQEVSRHELTSLQADIVVARGLLAEARGGLQGRDAGLRALADAVSHCSLPQSVFAVAFRFDRMRGLVQRYGPEVAEELLFLLIKERLHRLAPETAVYRWAASSIVSLLTCDRELEALRDEVNELSRQPLVHRIGVGDRTATLTLVPSHMVCQIRQDTIESSLEELDRFAMVGA